MSRYGIIFKYLTQIKWKFVPLQHAATHCNARQHVQGMRWLIHKKVSTFDCTCLPVFMLKLSEIYLKISRRFWGDLLRDICRRSATVPRQIAVIASEFSAGKLYRMVKTGFRTWFNAKMTDTEGLRYSPIDPYYRFGPVHTCLYVRARETGDWDLFLGPLEWARAETGGADRWVL